MTSNNLIKLIEFDPFRSGVRFGISSGSVRVQFVEISNIIWFGRFGSLRFIALAPQFGIATVYGRIKIWTKFKKRENFLFIGQFPFSAMIFSEILKMVEIVGDENPFFLI